MFPVFTFLCALYFIHMYGFNVLKTYACLSLLYHLPYPHAAQRRLKRGSHRQAQLRRRLQEIDTDPRLDPMDKLRRKNSLFASLGVPLSASVPATAGGRMYGQETLDGGICEWFVTGREGWGRWFQRWRVGGGSA